MNKNQNNKNGHFEGYYYQHPLPEIFKTVVELRASCKDEVELREKLRESSIDCGEEVLHSMARYYFGDTQTASLLHSFIDSLAGAAKLNNHLQAEEERKQIEMANARLYEYYMRTVRRNPWRPQ